MPISHGVPTSDRIPGTRVELNIANAQRGLTPLQSRLALVGLKSSAGSQAALTPVQVFSEAEADSLFGAGSELALMCRWALKAARTFGISAELWAVAITDPAATRKQFTFTVTGTATAGGDIVLKIAGRTIRIGVQSGDAQNTIATAIDGAIDAAIAELPITSAVATNVVTCSAVQTGVLGEDIEPEVISSVAGVTVAVALTVTGAGAYDITAALDTLVDRNYDIVATAIHSTTSIADNAAHLNAMWGSGEKKFRWTICVERGNLSAGQTLATAANDYRQMVVSCEGFKNTGGEIAAYIGMMLAAEERVWLPWNDVELPDLYLPDAADVPTTSELNTGIAGGLFMLSVNGNFSAAKIVRAVTTKVSHNSVPFYTLLDVSIPRAFVYGVRQIDIRLSLLLSLNRLNKTTRTRKLVRSNVLDVMYLLEEVGAWHNIDQHISELELADDPAAVDRLVIGVPATPVPPLNQVIGVYNLLVE